MKCLKSLSINKHHLMDVILITISLLVYLTNKLWLADNLMGALGYFCRCYLNDLVCPLGFLSVAEIVLSWADLKTGSYLWCICLGVGAGLIWEFFAPVINSKSVTDILDLCCYFVGSNVYWMITNKHIKTN